MKVLHVITSFPPAYDYGGPVESSYNIAKELVDRGHEVTVFTTDVKDSESRVGHYKDPEYVDGIRVRRFRNISNRLAWEANISSAIGIWPALRTELSDFDLVHLHEFRSIEAAITGHEAGRQGIPLVLQPRGSLPRRSKSMQKRIFDRIFGQRVIRSTDRLIASSQVESGQYDPTFPTVSNIPISHLPNGINPSEYADIPDPDIFRREYGVPDQAEIVLYLGRIHERKGIDLLLEAFSALDREQETLLVVVGPDDGYLDELRRLCDDLGCENVIFPGPKYGEEKLAAYATADVFVLPSENEYESFGNVVLEALASGTPAVATNVCGVSEWVSNRWCHTVEPTMASIRDGIEDVLDRQPFSSDEIREYVYENFTWATVVEQTEAVYQEMSA